MDIRGPSTHKGDLTNTGALSVQGNTALGNATTDTTTVTGTLTVSIPDNTATALDLKEASTSYLKLVSTNDAERVKFGKRVNVATQSAIAMGGSNLVLTAATLTGNIVLASCTGAARDLTLPAPTTYDGYVGLFYNTGSESIVLKDDGAATLTTITAGSKAVVASNGTNWIAGLLT